MIGEVRIISTKKRKVLSCNGAEVCGVWMESVDRRRIRKIWELTKGDRWKRTWRWWEWCRRSSSTHHGRVRSWKNINTWSSILELQNLCSYHVQLSFENLNLLLQGWNSSHTTIHRISNPDICFVYQAIRRIKSLDFRYFLIINRLKNSKETHTWSMEWFIIVNWYQ